MRWPNRKVHKLTPGMRRAQQAVTGFLGLIDWPRFRRRNLNDEIQLGTLGLTVCGCGDESQAVAWLLRTDALAPDGRVRTDVAPLVTRVAVPGLRPGRYSVVAWDTRAGAEHSRREVAITGDGGLMVENVSVTTDLALAIRRVE
jgi:mannan endo-1,4-beta-mannosidase